ncbi:putative tetratricopeptide-like helical domain superfamily [Helianthus annuus]|nr:putative tetratricopeptide-like helical domain superfamily [Helianthus annuus]
MAEAVLKEMEESGFQPNIYVLISLIQCYGKADRTDDVGTTFDRIIALGITPDERTCGCLLNVMTQTPREELDFVFRIAYDVRLTNDGLSSPEIFIIQHHLREQFNFLLKAVYVSNSRFLL